MDPFYLIGDELEDEADEEEIELLGELMGEDPILGQRAALHRRIPAFRSPSRRMSSRKRLKKALVPATPGVPKPGARELVIGFTPVQFTETSALNFNMTAEPQIPIKGRRLVIDVVRSAEGSGGLLTIVDLRVGVKSQLASAQPIIIAGYAPGAFGVDMALDPAVPGTVITLTIAATAQPGAGETVDVGAMLVGLSIG